MVSWLFNKKKLNFLNYNFLVFIMHKFTLINSSYLDFIKFKTSLYIILILLIKDRRTDRLTDRHFEC